MPSSRRVAEILRLRPFPSSATLLAPVASILFPHRPSWMFFSSARMRVYMCIRADLNFKIEHIPQRRAFPSAQTRMLEKFSQFFLIRLESFIYRNYPLFTEWISDRFLSRFIRLWFIVGISRATCGSHRGLWWFRKPLFNSFIVWKRYFFVVIAHGFSLFEVISITPNYQFQI